MAKRALLIGINKYKYPSFNLRGCINDINSWQQLLIDNFGFYREDIRRLVNEKANRKAILDNLRRLVTDVSDGDTIVFIYAGHGTQVGTTDDGEIDGKNEAIVPWEVNLESLILDNELREIFYSLGEERFKKISFTTVFDCCHSGTMTRDFLFSLLIKGELPPDDDGEMPPFIVNRCLNMIDLVEEPSRKVQLLPYDNFSACQDQQTAADIFIKEENRFRGAFSYSVINAIKNNIDHTIEDLELEVKKIIPRITPKQQDPEFYSNNSSKKVFTI